LRVRRAVLTRGWSKVVLALMVIALGAAGFAFFGTSEPIRQQAANTLATFSMGETLEGARLERISCSKWRSSGRGGGAVRHCDATVAEASGQRTEVEIASSLDLEDDEPVRIATVAGRVGIGFPLGTTLADWPSNLIFFAVFGWMIYFGASHLRIASRPLRHAAFVRRARIVDVDLLRRVMLDKRRARWDYAFDLDGRRHLATEVIDLPPVLTDGVVSRGAALVAPNGRAMLGTSNFAELGLPLAERERMTAQITALFDAVRPPLRDEYHGLVAVSRPGPERDYVEAFRDAWNAPDVPTANAAIERRHNAALALSRETVDGLLRDCRSMISGS
ncbi:MAG: hypothetical protein M3177_05030, partial [Pseudomonadota bacterium]|nr:hypothetical protein [Pseudomonadota bacterium]